jgi:hypothetical protein
MKTVFVGWVEKIWLALPPKAEKAGEIKRCESVGGVSLHVFIYTPSVSGVKFFIFTLFF